MDDLLTLDKIVALPHTMLHNSESISEYTQLLSESYCEQFDLKKFKKDIEDFIKEFNNIKYTFRYDLIVGSRVTSNYNFDSSTNTNSNINNDKTGNIACNIVDNRTWLTQVYNSFLTLSNKFTIEEAVYFVSTFFSDLSETKISDSLRMCRNTLQKYKKSALVKSWFELKVYLDNMTR